jgi:nucleotide-binding universal stress UspA family protein
MAYRVILVPLLGDAADATALDIAQVIGDRTHAHIVCAHVRPLLWSGGTDVCSGPMPLNDTVIDMIEEHSRRQTGIAREKFQAWLRQHSIRVVPSPGGRPTALTAEWIESEAAVSHELASLARTSDLVVLARTAREYAPASDEALHGTLFESGRPVLVVPGAVEPRAFETVLIAWNDSREAALAVAAAWSLIGRAKRIVVFVGSANDARRQAANRFSRQIGWRGYAPPTVVFDESNDPGAALLRTAQRDGADLIVMGAYTHSRLRHLVFGGVTSRVLSESATPILMAH